MTLEVETPACNAIVLQVEASVVVSSFPRFRPKNNVGFTLSKERQL